MHANKFLVLLFGLLTEFFAFSQMENMQHNYNLNLVNKDEVFSNATEGLPFVRNAQVIKLKNGQNYTLIAKQVKQNINGKIIKRFAYNGSIPGPIIEVQKGSKVKIKFINQTEVDQTLHSHGLRLNYLFDGTVGLGQKAPVRPGETFEYELYFPDTGVFFYHPHIREDYAQDMGLYGNYLVNSNKQNNVIPVNKMVPIILDDILLTDTNNPYYKGYANYAAMGRFGNIMLINGVDNYKENFTKGEIIRFFITNSANTRTFNFNIPGAKMKLIAADMSPFEKQEWIESLIIAPSERYIVDVYFKDKGIYKILNSNSETKTQLGLIEVLEGKLDNSFVDDFMVLHADTTHKNEMQKLSKHFNKKVDKNLIISVDMKMDHSQHGELPEIEWEDNMPKMNEHMTSKDVAWLLIDKETNKKNMDVFWSFKKGQYYKIKIFNDPKSKHPMQHPIHFHGQRFLVLTDNKVKNNNLAWKDTVLVKTGHTVEILLEASNISKWMSHCHIAEHLSSGMAIGYSVE